LSSCSKPFWTLWTYWTSWKKFKGFGKSSWSRMIRDFQFIHCQ